MTATNNSVIDKWMQYASDRDEVNFLKRAQEAPAPRGGGDISEATEARRYAYLRDIPEEATFQPMTARSEPPVDINQVIEDAQKAIEEADLAQKRAEDAKRVAEEAMQRHREFIERKRSEPQPIQSIRHHANGGPAVFHFPTIYDFEAGKEREVTQEDVNELLHIRAAYVHLKQKVYESVTESTEIIKSGDVMVNERFDFESKEAEDLWYNDRTDAQDAEREADPNYHDVYQDACDAYNAIISAAAEKQEVHINK